jgi:hypothetical protein
MTRQLHEAREHGGDVGTATAHQVGRHTLTEALGHGGAGGTPGVGKHTLVESLQRTMVQRQVVQRQTLPAAPATEAVTGNRAVEVAAEGVASGGAALPYLGQVQAAFGSHDIGGIEAHHGPEAVAANQALGAEAYATGDRVAFASSSPSMHTVAHEAAHVVQQRAGVQLKGGVGAAGDVHEQHADAVADAVVAGRSAEALLSSCAGGAQHTSGQAAVQKKGAASGETDLFDGARAPDSKQQGKIDHILNPTGAGGATSKKYKQAGFVAGMTTAIDAWRKASTTGFKALSGPNSFTLDMPQARKTGDAAQKVVTDKYGAYVKAASTGAGASDAAKPGYKVSDPAVLHKQEDSIDPLSSGDQIDMVQGLVSYAMEQPDGGKKVVKDHNVDLTRSPDKDDYNQFIADYAKAHFAELKKIQEDWPGEEHPWDGTIYIQLRREKNAKLAAKESSGKAKFADANLRLGYWSTFQTLIHEYLHAAAHGNWRHIEDSAPASQAHIMVEGTCEYFTERAYKDVAPKIPGDDALREQVEGKKYPYAPEVIPPWSGYDSRKDVAAIVKAMGGNEQNLRDAYFLGHVELIGLGDWKNAMHGEGRHFEVAVDDTPIATVADLTFVSAAEIQKANGWRSSHNKLKKGTITVPGISYHHAVAGDTQSSIAKQHGVTPAGLAKANPGVADWTKLTSGQRLLIPAH